MGNFLTSEQVGGIVRAFASATIGYAAAKGYIAPADAEWLVAGVGGAAVAIWSWWLKRPAA